MTAAAKQIRYGGWWRWGVTAALVFILAYIAISHRDLVGRSARILSHASGFWVTAALLASCLTFCIAAAIYKQLAMHPLRYGQTVLVEVAASFANRLLPAGLGGLGLHGLYLHRRKHTTAEATAVVSINNALGLTAHLSLLGLVVAARPSVVSRLHHHWPALVIGGIAIGLATIIIIAGLIPASRGLLGRFGRNLIASLRRLRPAQLVRSYLLAVLLTVAYTTALYCSAHAVHLLVSPLQAFIIFSIGAVAGTATPTPGGLVGIEAGLYAGFVGYGALPSGAAAATLLYRVCTYWLPLLPGFGSLIIARQRRLV